MEMTEMTASRLLFGWANDAARTMGSGGSSSSTSTRWGTVVAVNGDGTIDVQIDGVSDVVTVHADGIYRVGDRVTLILQNGTYMVYGLAGVVETITEQEQEFIDFSNTITESLEELGTDLTDSKAETWFYAYDPTTSNEPASTWTDTEKQQHTGDLFYNTQSGKTWYWNGSSWVHLEDEDIGQALSDAAAAQDTADGKRTVFYSATLPTPPYQLGDLWTYGADKTSATGGDLLVCISPKKTGQTAQESDWVAATYYSDTISDIEAELITFADSLDELSTQVDGKVETWFYTYEPTASNVPASNWTTSALKTEHTGDLFFNTSTGYCYRWTGSAWSQITDSRITNALSAANDAQTTADGKRTVFYASTLPTPPYQIGDLWTYGSDTTCATEGEILVCIASRQSGQTAQQADWVAAASYSDKISNIEEELITFSDSLTEFSNSLGDLSNQVDGKVETWFYSYAPTTSNVPASNWTTSALKTEHTGDLFFNTSTGYCYRWTGSAWSQITDSRITSAMNTASDAQDTADSKRRVFTSTPYGPYDPGDLWVQGSTGDIKVCKTAEGNTGNYYATDWTLASKYTDDSEVTSLANTFELQDETVYLYYKQAGTTNSWTKSRSVTWHVFKPTTKNKAPILFWTSIDLHGCQCSRAMDNGEYWSYYEYKIDWPSAIGALDGDYLPEVLAGMSCYADIAYAHSYSRNVDYLGPLIVVNFRGGTVGYGGTARMEIFCSTRTTRG